MAAEPGLIAAFFERSLERKKKAKENDRAVQQQKETRSPGGQNEDSRRTINAIWTETPPKTVDGPRRGTTAQRDTGPVDADLPDSEDEDAEAEGDDDFDASGALWDDPDFLTPSSIKLTAKTITAIEWMRPPAIAAQFGAKAQFVVEGTSHYDINQGELGNCWYLSAVACLASLRNKELLGRILPSNQNFQHRYSGKFRFRFWDFGKWRTIAVDDRLPTEKDQNGVNQLIFGRNNSQPHEFWIPLMEKAFVKLKGGRYENVEGGNANTALLHFTGGVSFTLDPTKMDATALFDKVNSCLNTQHGLVTSITQGRQTSGLVPSHVYCIPASMTVQLDGKTHQIFRLFNPWGKGEWTGPWSDGSREFNSVKNKYNLMEKDDGEFWMSVQDFRNYFINTSICLPGPGKKDKDQDSNNKSFFGRWSGSTAAGGDVGNANYWNNPQYEFAVAPPTSGGSRTNKVVISVLQRTDRSSEQTQIGFYLFQLRQNSDGKVDANSYAQRVQKQICCTVNSTTDVSSIHDLEPAGYLVVPCTWKPGVDMKFLLRIFTDTQLTCGRLDVQSSSPGSSAVGFSSSHGVGGRGAGSQRGRTSEGHVDKTQRLFRKYSGGDDQMDAAEFADSLKEILGKEDGNSIADSGAESGRSLLALLGYSRSHLLSVEEFRNIVDTLTAWKQKFESLRGLRRSVRCRQIRDVFPALGHMLTDEVITKLRERYTFARDEDDSVMTLHSFVHCCCRIVCMLGEFERLSKTGVVIRNDLALTEWLTSTLPY